MTNRHSLLMLLLLGACGLQQLPVRAAPEVVVLRTRQRVGYDAKFAKQVSGLLPRELARQALLIAARDELGLATRDQSLRESASATDETIELLLTVDAKLDGNCLVQVSQFADDHEDSVWSRTLKFKPNSKRAYPSLIEQLDSMSRSEFVDLLVQLGAARPADKGEDEAAQPSAQQFAELDERLSEVDLVSQFLAVRKIVQMIKSQGESPELLGRLANGYANLSLLTESHWGATSRALMARSLLYAERLRTRFPNYLLVRWHWAYVRAMAGIHFAAMDEIADPLPEGVDRAELPSLPDWAELIEAYCQYDTKELGELADSGNNWARYLRLWCFYLSKETRRISTTAEETVNACPFAFDVYYLLAHEGSLGVMHRVSRASVSAMYYACAKNMAEDTELPGLVRQAASLPATKTSPLVGWGAAVESLRKADDGSDPNWQTLATLLEDTAAQVAAANLRVARGGSTEQSLAPYVEAFLPALKDSPYLGYFVACKFSSKNEADKVTDACRDLRFVDPSLWIKHDTRSIWGTQNSRGEPVGYNAYYGASRDFTAISLFVNSERPSLSDDFQYMLLRELRKVSPSSPMVLVNEIKAQIKQIDQVKPEEVSAWEERAGASSTAWHQLGAFYLKRKEYADSCRCYQSSYMLSPTHATSRDWAWAHEYANELEKVVPTLKRYLEEEDYGLGHSNTHYEIARFYLRHDRAEEAKPHALEAAQSWSARGLSIAARVSDRLDIADEAEKWYRELSQSYPTSSGLKWYLWRRRSGVDDGIEEPRRLAKQQLGPQALQECKSAGWWPLAYCLMERDLDLALQLVWRRVQEEPGLYSDAHLLAVALEKDDQKLVDQTHDKFTELANRKEDADDSWAVRFSEAIDTIMIAESDGQIPVETFDALVRDESATIGWCDACYFLSKVLEARGFSEHSDRFRDLATSYDDHNRITWHLSKFDAQRLKSVETAP